VARTWFRLHPRCDHCGLDIQREPGFYLGSIYFNYGLTSLVLIVTCVPAVLWQAVPVSVLTPLALAFCVAFPLWFLRYARALWLGFDVYFDPQAGARGSAIRRE
jgi:hypothetical protein